MPDRKTFTILGVTIDRTTMADAIDWIVTPPEPSTGPAVGLFANAHCLNISVRDRAYRKVMAKADRVFADGSGIRLACRLLGHDEPENVNGTDLLPHLCDRLSATGQALYLLGAAPGVVDQMAENLRERWPGLRIAGTHHGYLGTAEETAAALTAINNSGADVLLVAMGVPAQELWIARHRDQLTVGAVLGVGGLFDFFSGRIPRAPQWLRRTGMEWTWRLAQEPARMWRRYILGNPKFVNQVWQGRQRDEAGDLREARLIERYRTLRRHWNATAVFHLRRMAWSSLTTTGEVAKRAVDIAGSGSALLLLTPLWLLLALAIRLESPGPVLFSQMRVGQHGRPFRLWKFRSMFIDAEARKAELMARNEMQGGVLFKMKNDPRITRVGRLIRRASIDEMPQLWNILNGDMSLVGPRPPLPSEVAQYSIRDRRRLDSKPGLTCIWQVSGRSTIPFDRQVDMDIDYTDGRTFLGDVKLILRTIPAVLTGRGAC